MTMWLALLPDLLPKITSQGTVGSPYQELWPAEPLQGRGCKGRGIECTKRSESELFPVNENSSWSKPKCDLKGNVCYQTTSLDLASSSLFEGVASFCQMSHLPHEEELFASLFNEEWSRCLEGPWAPYWVMGFRYRYNGILVEWT